MIILDMVLELYASFCLIGGALLFLALACHLLAETVQRCLDLWFGRAVINEAVIRVIQEKKEREKQVDKA